MKSLFLTTILGASFALIGAGSSCSTPAATADSLCAAGADTSYCMGSWEGGPDPVPAERNSRIQECVTAVKNAKCSDADISAYAKWANCRNDGCQNAATIQDAQTAVQKCGAPPKATNNAQCDAVFQ